MTCSGSASSLLTTTNRVPSGPTSSPPPRDRHPGAARAQGSVAQLARSRATAAAQRGSSGAGDEQAIGGECVGHLALGLRDRLHRAEALQVRRAEAREHADLRLHEVAELGDVADSVSAELGDEVHVAWLEALVDRAHDAEVELNDAGVG